MSRKDTSDHVVILGVDAEDGIHKLTHTVALVLIELPQSQRSWSVHHMYSASNWSFSLLIMYPIDTCS